MLGGVPSIEDRRGEGSNPKKVTAVMTTRTEAEILPFSILVFSLVLFGHWRVWKSGFFGLGDLSSVALAWVRARARNTLSFQEPRSRMLMKP